MKTHRNKELYVHACLSYCSNYYVDSCFPILKEPFVVFLVCAPLALPGFNEIEGMRQEEQKLLAIRGKSLHMFNEKNAFTHFYTTEKYRFHSRCN